MPKGNGLCWEHTSLLRQAVYGSALAFTSCCAEHQSQREMRTFSLLRSFMDVWLFTGTCAELCVQGALQHPKNISGLSKTFPKLLWPSDAKNWLIWKDPDAGKDWRWEKGTTEDETVGWHRQLNGHEFKYALGVGDGQGGLVCCSPWGCKESGMTEQLNWTENSNGHLTPKLFLLIKIFFWSDRYLLPLLLLPKAAIMLSNCCWVFFPK